MTRGELKQDWILSELSDYGPGGGSVAVARVGITLGSGSEINVKVVLSSAQAPPPNAQVSSATL